MLRERSLHFYVVFLYNCVVTLVLGCLIGEADICQLYARYSEIGFLVFTICDCWNRAVSSVYYSVSLQVLAMFTVHPAVMSATFYRKLSKMKLDFYCFYGFMRHAVIHFVSNISMIFVRKHIFADFVVMYYVNYTICHLIYTQSNKLVAFLFLTKKVTIIYMLIIESG